MKYHVHVYTVRAMLHLDIDADDAEQAREAALEGAMDVRLGHWLPADCKMVSIEPAAPMKESDEA